MTTQLDEVGLEAARKQKIRNLQLKTMCLENEEFIQELHITDFSQTQKSKLDAAHEKAGKLIKNVEQGTKWNLAQSYDLPKLLRVCGLQMNPKELAQPTDQAQFMDIIALRKTLQELRQHKNKNKVVSISDLLERYIVRLDEAEASLRRSQVDATDIAAVPAEALKVVEDCMNVQGTFMSTASIDERVKQQLKLIERANEVQNIALADGEMSVAEEQYYTKISLQEMLLQLVNNKFLILDATREQNIPFKDKRPVEVKAQQTTSQIHERKRKLKEKCEADLSKLNDALNTADAEDRSAMQRHAQAQQLLEAGLGENIKQQDECWARIQEMERELQRLGTVRFEEVKRMLEECDKEEKRRVEYNQFLEVVTEHRRALELTVYNCDVTMSLTGIVEGLVSESVEYVMKRYETTEKDIAEGRLEIYKEQLEAFRQLYLTLGQLLYKKEKALEEIDQQIRVSHIQLEFCIETFDPMAKKHSDEKKDLYSKRAMCEEELEMIKEKMIVLAEQFAPTEDILTKAGIDFLHPARELEETNLHRRTKLVGYAQTLQQREEEKIIREREDIKRSQSARSPRHPALPPSGSPSPSPRLTSPPAARILGPRTPTPP